MAKKEIAKAIQTPEIYKGLIATNTQATLTLVIDKNGQVFKFSDPSKIHILKDAISYTFNGWADSFDKQPKNDILEWHKRLFGVEAPEGQELIQSSLMCYMKLVSTAQDRTDEANTLLKNKDKKLATRTYTYHENGDTSLVKTPQARVCIAILKDSVNPDTKTILEVDLKSAVDRRASELRTRQEPWRIFQYYRALLIKAKILTHD